ncbi:DUF3299 domain-containing protein [Halioglobus pacificus]|uniref:DUF3299 domain-containing protein n=1 Tax=Parahalioglobus pacificus TaxID=930806 RepID=A0A918XM69_9GAMM|nr:DUF3299 domain-containing protein [Halioglobus pacificus]GHD39175.1 hypothetical protein GCM10007053_30460 [Halioglobus pacificus]
MVIVHRLTTGIVVAVTTLILQLVLSSGSQAVNEEASFETIEWVSLIPEDVLEILLNPPEYISDIEDGSADDTISSQIKNALTAASDDKYQQALVSTEVNADMNGAMVRIPGFVVPLEFNDDQTVTQFFLVPYFGACLHMPPPPPNQIILVNAAGQGIPMPDLYVPFWISGKLETTISENEIAMSAYSLEMMAHEIYDE